MNGFFVGVLIDQQIVDVVVFCEIDVVIVRRFAELRRGGSGAARTGCAASRGET